MKEILNVEYHQHWKKTRNLMKMNETECDEKEKK